MDHFKRLRILFFVHGLITLAAAVVLTIAPGLIPGVVGIHFDSSSNLIAYLLAGAEFGFAVLSFGGSRLADVRALRLIAWSFVAFHSASAALESYAYFTGTSSAILANIAARVIIVCLFLIFSRPLDQLGPRGR
jgi:hypothetical protein